MTQGPPIASVQVEAFTIPTEDPESDGTLAWDSTGMIVVRVQAGGMEGLGYTYADPALTPFIRARLAPRILGIDAYDVSAAWLGMVSCVRNLGQGGLAALAISAVDIALWDLKSRLLRVPLAALLGRIRPRVPAYGSGGFTSYTIERLCAQLQGWVGQGMRLVKMKVGSEPRQDPIRVQAARDAVGPDVGLMVDANGAYDIGQAAALADAFAAAGVIWFEEPVCMTNLDGLAHLRQRLPRGMEVAAGEYCFQLVDAERLLRRRAVDVLQLDATRCLGISGFIALHALAQACEVPVSAHCAPAVHAHLGLALQRMRHVECFHDHVRIETMLFAGCPRLERGFLIPDPEAPGLGLAFKARDARGWAA